MDEHLARYQRAAPLPSIDPGHSGYFVAPKAALDPALFDAGEGFRDEVRRAILSKLFTFWRGKYDDPQVWATVWIAGSAISYQWHGDRGGVGDLDVLVGVDIPRFLEVHPQFSGIPEPLIAKRFNAEFQKLQATTKRWSPGGAGPYEVTFYVNPGAANIKDIHPYAAYDLTHDNWTVRPVKLPAGWDPHTYFPELWWSSVNGEISLARTLLQRYDEAARAIKGARPATPNYATAVARLADAAAAVKALYDDIHAGRKNAFSQEGQGYFDYFNLRWQAHKRAGTEQAMRAVNDLVRSASQARNLALYGEKDIGTEKAVLDASLAPHGLRGLL